MKHPDSNQALYEKMTQTPIPRLVIQLAIPTMISMLTAALYNTADTFFVAKLGTSAAGAVGIVFSIMAIIQSIGFMLGMGAGSQISRALGAQDEKRANTTASTSFFMSLVIGTLVTVIGLLFLHPLLRLLGSTPTILPYAADYARYILLGAPIMCASYVLNNLLRAEGKASFSMIGITLGGILNMILDPLFIFVLQLGIAGAAIATLLSQCVSFLILLSVFLRKKSAIRLHINSIAKTPKGYGRIMILGLPSFARQGLASAATATLNAQAGLYGDPAVAAMSIVTRIFMLIFSIIIGLGQGFQPVAGHNYGAGKYKRVKEAILFSVKTATAILVILSAAIFILAPEIMRLFRADDAQVVSIGTLALRFQCITMPFIPLYTISGMTFQVLGRSRIATIVSSARQGIFFLPAILILPALIGVKGLQMAQPIADLCSFALCLFFIIPMLKEL